MIPTITANIEPHVRLSVTEDEPAPVEEKFVDLECGVVGVTESPCCEVAPRQSEYDPERVLKALGMSFVFGGLVATALCFAFSGPPLE